MAPGSAGVPIPETTLSTPPRRSANKNITTFLSCLVLEIHLSLPEHSKVQTDYDNTTAEARRTATERYRQPPERERQERWWAAGGKVGDKWPGILVKGQWAFLDM